MSITHRIDRMLSSRADRTVLRAGGRSWSGAEFDEITATVARGLVAAGVGTDSVVELHTDDHTDAVLLMTAVLRAGGGFCVVPPSYPQARVEQIRSRTRPVAVLHSVAEGLAAGESATAELPVRGADGADPLAYVIFTSGSTGDPKAVEITDANLAHLADQPGIYPGEVMAHAATLQFDACIYEILGGLLNGMTIAVLDLDDLLDRRMVARVLDGVDVLFVTTAIFNLLADRAPHAFDGLQLVLFGGERVSPRHVRNVVGRCRVMHAYGPTETTVFATLHEVDAVADGADVPIGRGLAGSCTHVLDEHGAPVADGEPGELVIGGHGLMRGYRDQPDATARAVLQLHDRPHYRTGDLVTAVEGEVTFVGRRDRQVKLKGYRVDLAEIEDVALAFVHGPGSSAGRAVAVAEEGVLRLFVVGCRDLAGLRAHLREVLPRYTVPVVTPIGSIPLTRNGKTDTAALLELARRTNPAQERAREVFAGIVGGDDTAATFLDLGGDSLSAMDAVWRLADEGVGVDLEGLLTRPLEEVLADVA